ncbi:MAG TPA: prepilin peptidase [Desulfobacterales bacterium]|nr:prepilin peptidase [Desulfobacterales bacterium]
MEWVVFVFGLCIGSFLNVCIYRLPLSKSIVHPRSACPDCGHPIRAYDNIPVASYLMLRGRCRDCGVRIPARYPLVELLSGAFAAMAVLKFGAGWQGLLMYGVIAALLVITFIDIDHRIIPDLITLPGIPIGVAASFFGLTHVSPLESLIGVLAGGGSLFLVAWGYQLITKREGMGGGDIKLLAMIGAFFGWQGVLFTIFVASLSGSLAGLALILRSHGDMKLAVPFGPFLAVGALGYLFIGPEVLYWYIYWMKH